MFYRTLTTLLFVSLAFSLPAAVNAQSDDDYTALLKKISEGHRTLAFKGTFTREKFEDGEMKFRLTDRVLRIGFDKRWAKRIYPERSWYANLEIVHIGNMYYMKDLKTDSVSVRSEPPRTGIVQDVDDIVFIKQNYYIKILRQEKLNGRTNDVVKIISRTHDRPYLKLWVDRENGFVHRFEKYDQEDNKLYQEYVEDVLFDPEYDPALFEVEYAGEIPGDPKRITFKSISEVLQEINSPIMVLQQIPPGFILDKIVVTQRPENRRSVQFYYMDGLTQFSFFQVPTDRKEADIRFGNRGNRDIDGDYEAWTVSDGMMYYLTGDLPEESIRTMLKNLKLVKKDANLR